jgi:peptidoglycan/LPS O-acetylase OafA/YrhL
LTGVLLGVAFRTRSTSWRWMSLAAAPAAIALVVMVTFTGRDPTMLFPHLLAVPLFVVIIGGVAASDAPSTGILASAPLVLLGESSYALYMLHGPLHGYVLAAFNRVAPSVGPGVQFACYVAAAISLSVMAYRMIERPNRARIRAWYEGRRLQARLGAE